jgi:hypothetical protein
MSGMAPYVISVAAVGVVREIRLGLGSLPGWLERMSDAVTYISDQRQERRRDREP